MYAGSIPARASIRRVLNISVLRANWGFRIYLL